METVTSLWNIRVFVNLRTLSKHHTGENVPNTHNVINIYLNLL